jgi:hypothetical protein
MLKFLKLLILTICFLVSQAQQPFNLLLSNFNANFTQALKKDSDSCRPVLTDQVVSIYCKSGAFTITRYE